MRTRTRLLGLIVCAWVLIVVAMPCSALADVIVTPTDQKLPVVTTATATTGGSSTVAGHAGSEVGTGTWILFGAVVFLGPLLLTLLIEVPVIAVAGGGSAASWKVGILANTLTNPPAVLIVLLLTPAALTSPSPLAMFMLVGAVELAVVIAEWRIFRWALGWSNRRAIITSLVANALSFGIGLAVLSGKIPI